MANKPLKSIKFPGLPDTYIVPQVDNTLTKPGQPADAKTVGDEIADLKEDTIQTAGVVEEMECDLTDEVKTALLDCFTHVAWIGDDGQTYYDALSNALNRSRVISSISAIFTQGSATIYDTDELYALKQYLTVTVTYSDGTTKEVNNYTLSGQLVAGTSTITVAYNKKTTAFNVTVTHQAKTLESISATFSSSASITTDNVLDDLRPYLTVRATYSDGSTNTITNYALSGSLNVGTNTITVTYNNKTATFTVNVTEAEVVLQSITAVFNQGSAAIYTDSSLNDLKPYLTVTARYSDSTTQTVTNYTLSGTLTKGTSTITASYGGKTATFNVAVNERSVTLQSITATFTQGSAVIYTDSSLDDLKPYLTVTAIYSDSTTQTVTGYTLSGTLTAGTSTITVSYGGKTATFSVNVTASGGTIDRIDADFNKGTNKIYESTSLDTLKQYLTITIHYSDGTTGTAALTDYSLTGALVGGTNSVVTVTYNRGGATGSTSFTVDVESIMYDWDFTESMYDKVANAYATPSAGDGYLVPSRTSNGFEINGPTQILTFIDQDANINHLDMTVEIDVASFDFKGDSTKHVRFFMDQRGDASNSVGTGPLIFRADYGWTAYGYSDAEHIEAGYRKWSDTGWGSLYDVNQINALNGKTVKIYYGADGHTRKLYLDGTLIGTMTDVYFYKPTLRLRLGGGTSYSASSGDQCYDMTISGIRIYRGEV